MRELSLHILDLVENSLRAQATKLLLRLEVDSAHDLLCIYIEDNGVGLAVTPEQASDPFYTTKAGKRTGLGLSLFRAAAEAAGGRMTIGKSQLGGVAVVAEMQLSHIDRSPLGDLAGTVAIVVATNPALDLELALQVNGRAVCIAARPATETEDSGDTLAAARRVLERIRTEVEELRAGTDIVL